MFGMKAQQVAYEKVIGHLEREINRLTKFNNELTDRLMAKTFQEYQIMKDQPAENSGVDWPAIPEPGTVVTYEADAHETG